MPIYQDELTFVKVDDGVDGTDGKNGIDGKDTYLHKAWSWSSDGTDRFTTKYPNENLLLNTNNTKIPQYYSTPYSSSRVNIVNTKHNEISVTTKEARDAFYRPLNNVSINDLGIIGDKFTLTFDYMTPSTNYLRIRTINFKSGNNVYVFNGVGKAVITVEIINNGGTYISFDPISTSSGGFTVGDTFKVSNLKFEKSSEPTIYTPSPIDDFENAYPKYEGYYSSHNPVQSTNPSDYTWTPIPREPGKDGEPGQNAAEVISGSLSNDSIILSATSTGVVSDYSKAYGDFVVYEGQNKLANGVTYTKVSETGMTSSINASGRYTVTNITTDTAMAIYRATYKGVQIDKQILVVKNKQGATGSPGVGVSSAEITYQAGISGTTTPTGTWSESIPTVSENQFLWTRTITTYSDNSSSTGYSVSKIGGKGATGNGVANTIVNYASSTNGTVTPTTGWTTTIPTVSDGSFLWTRTVLTFSNNTTNTSYSVAKQGSTGPKGEPTGITTQPTIPTSPYIGMLWQNTGNIPGYLTGATYQWNGAKWNLYIFMAENIVAETLSSIVANTGKLNVTDDITLTTDNKVLKGYFDFGDRFAQAYYDRWFTGDFELGRRYLRYSGDIFEVNQDNTKGKFMHNAESFYGLDYFKMRTYDNKTSKNLVGRIDIHSQAIQLGDSWGSPNATIQSNGFVTAKEVLADRIGPNSGSTLTIGESSWISGMLLTESNTYFNSKRTDLADFRVGKDGSALNGGRVVKSDAIYNRTYSGGANMIVTGDGVLGRVTSARKYKDDIQVADNVIKNAKEVLKIKPSSWLDKGDLADRKDKVRYHGFIADEFDELGLTEVVVYDHDGDVDSLNYDRIPIYHNVILSEHEERIKYLENEVAELKEFIEKWKAVQN